MNQSRLLTFIVLLFIALSVVGATTILNRTRSAGETSITLVEPKPHQPYRGTLQVQVDAQGESRIEFVVDQRIQGTLSNLGDRRWTGTFDTTTVADGAHKLVVHAYTANGERTSLEATFDVVNAAERGESPSIALLNPQKDVVVLDLLTIDVVATYAKSVTYRIDQQSPAFISPEGSVVNRWSGRVDTNSLAEGPHTLTVVNTGLNGHTVETSTSFLVQRNLETPPPATRSTLPPLPQGVTLPFFRELLAPSWVSWSWDTTTDFRNTTNVREGRHSVAFTTTTASAGFYLHTDQPLQTTPYLAIRFDLKPETPNQGLHAALYGTNNRQLRQPTDIAPYGVDQPGGWQTYTIPLADLGGQNRAIQGFLLQSDGVVEEARWYLDSLGLVGVNERPAQNLPDVDPRRANKLYGVNIAGAEFGTGGRYGLDYIVPNDREGYDSFGYFKANGQSLIRLPIKWERLQPQAYGPLVDSEVGRILDVLENANRTNQLVLLELHNYGRYNDKPLTRADAGMLGDVWQKLAGRVQTHPALYGYEIMNEPHDLPEKGEGWVSIAQSTTDAIRQVDRTSIIVIPGYNWQSAMYWREHNENLIVKDSANKLIYSAHQYFDRDGSGRYSEGYGATGAYPDIGRDRLKPFIDWLHAQGVKGMITEYGVPDSDPAWLTVLDAVLKTIESEPTLVGGTYWAAGPWWGTYSLSVEPIHGLDRPQMAILRQYPTR